MMMMIIIILLLLIIIIIKCSCHLTLHGSFQLPPTHRTVTERNEISDSHSGVDEDYNHTEYDDIRIGNYRRFGWACCLQNLLTSSVLSEDSHYVGLHCTSRRDVWLQHKSEQLHVELNTGLTSQLSTPTARNCVLPAKLIFAELFNNIPTFYGFRRFILYSHQPADGPYT
jgi:hypothetical protein